MSDKATSVREGSLDSVFFQFDALLGQNKIYVCLSSHAQNKIGSVGRKIFLFYFLFFIVIEGLIWVFVLN